MNALIRAMMMREAIASCAIEGITVTPERERELIAMAVADVDEREEEEGVVGRERDGKGILGLRNRSSRA